MKTHAEFREEFGKKKAEKGKVWLSSHWSWRSPAWLQAMQQRFGISKLKDIVKIAAKWDPQGE